MCFRLQKNIKQGRKEELFTGKKMGHRTNRYWHCKMSQGDPNKDMCLHSKQLRNSKNIQNIRRGFVKCILRD